MKRLSVIIPAYDEEAYIGRLLDEILAVDLAPCGFEKEILVVNDGSRDRTADIVASYEGRGVRRLDQIPNQGKGRAVNRGVQESTGDYILVQDADLEYDPKDYPALLRALERGDCVYGSRILGQLWQKPFSLTPGRHPQQGVGPWLAGVALTLWTALLYGRWITDTLTAYKLYPAPALKAMRLRTAGFETDHEITARLVRAGYSIVETPIAYRPRSVAEGKKIRARDGLIAIWTLLGCRFSNPPRVDGVAETAS